MVPKQLLEELQMKIIVSNEEVQAQIASCKETTHAWDKRLSKFDMTLFANESNKLRAFPLASARTKSKRDGRIRRPRSASRDGSTVPSSDNDSSGPAAPVPFAPRQQAAPMQGSTRRCRQGSRHRIQRHMETVLRVRRPGATKTHPMTGVPTIPNRETVAVGTRAQDQVLSDNRLASLTA
jgi:hypothetical protein